MTGWFVALALLGLLVLVVWIDWGVIAKADAELEAAKKDRDGQFWVADKVRQNWIQHKERCLGEGNKEIESTFTEDDFWKELNS